MRKIFLELTQLCSITRCTFPLSVLGVPAIKFEVRQKRKPPQKNKKDTPRNKPMALRSITNIYGLSLVRGFAQMLFKSGLEVQAQFQTSFRKLTRFQLAFTTCCGCSFRVRVSPLHSRPRISGLLLNTTSP